MKRHALVFVTLAALLGLSQPVLADDIYVVAGGGRAVGTAITPTTPLPYTISQPGFYYLTGNLTYSGSASAICISRLGVTLDLMGFNITNPSTMSAYGIYINPPPVRNL